MLWWRRRRERRFGRGWTARTNSVHVYMRSDCRENMEIDEI